MVVGVINRYTTAQVAYPEIIYVGNDLGVFATQDNGASWTNFSEGLPSAVLAYDLLLEHDARIIRVGTHGNGAYERKVLEFVTQAISRTSQL